jgi:hypothetical protein
VSLPHPPASATTVAAAKYTIRFIGGLLDD